MLFPAEDTHRKCCRCSEETATLFILGYTEVDPLEICSGCAKQLARYILEDLCALETTGGRHG